MIFPSSLLSRLYLCTFTLALLLIIPSPPPSKIQNETAPSIVVPPPALSNPYDLSRIESDTFFKDFDYRTYSKIGLSTPGFASSGGSAREWVQNIQRPGLQHSSSPQSQEILEHGIAPTDSGYASISHPRCQPESPAADVPKQSSRRTSSVGVGESLNDAQTLYSDATTANPAYSRAYVSELCQDIHDRVRRQTCLTPLPSLFSALPHLIKALAIKIGQESDNRVNREIMYFVHKSHR